jgi:hypothetical protein
VLQQSWAPRKRHLKVCRRRSTSFMARAAEGNDIVLAGTVVHGCGIGV